MKKFAEAVLFPFFGICPRFFVFITFGNIWRLRRILQKKRKKGGAINKLIHGVFTILNNAYWESYGSFIGILAVFEEPPVFPHGPLGIFVSNASHIGKGCVIYQQVTIGSNTLKDSKKQGAPYLEDDVYVGAGAKIIGNCRVGARCRIGANCIVVKDMAPDSVAVIRGIEFIQKEHLDNQFVPITKWLKDRSE